MRLSYTDIVRVSCSLVVLHVSESGIMIFSVQFPGAALGRGRYALFAYHLQLPSHLETTSTAFPLNATPYLKTV